jgi:predicted metal-binding protein
MLDDDLKPIAERALEWGVLDVRSIPTGDIAVAEWVRLKCHYGCPNYGKRLDCPPNEFTLDLTQRLLAEYRRALVLQLRRLPRYQPEGSGLVHRVERELFLSQFYRAFAIGAGSCGQCPDECVREAGKCPQQHRIRPACESLGIDLFATLHNAGWDLKVLGDRQAVTELPPSWSLILVD